MDFDRIFDTKREDLKNTDTRDKFLSRVFGIFNEEIVRIWCRSTNSHFNEIGRPTIKKIGDKTLGSTLDFTFQNKETKKNYVCEMKCEIQYQNFKYLKLTSINDFTHHNKIAFKRFLELALNPIDFEVKVLSKNLEIHGAILIWGQVDPLSINSICHKTGFFEVWSLEMIINDLLKTNNPEYTAFLNQRQLWLNYLFNELKE